MFTFMILNIFFFSFKTYFNLVEKNWHCCYSAQNLFI